MPLLAAIDECHCALTQIAVHAYVAAASVMARGTRAFPKGK